MATISTHVLDTARGQPAADMSVTLEAAAGDGWTRKGAAVTNGDGRAPDLLGAGERLEPGAHRLVFDTGAWFADQGVAAFYPYVTVTFQVTGDHHYHVPLLLSPFGYSTYRGS